MSRNAVHIGNAVRRLAKAPGEAMVRHAADLGQIHHPESCGSREKSHIAYMGAAQASIPIMDETSATHKELVMAFHGRILDQLGSQTYHSPVASIAELVANAWDADAESVNIRLPDDVNGEVVVKDDGIGLDFDECRDRYLNIGYCRRGKEPVAHTAKGRVVLGRKGIGKFAGFGIAKIIRVDTISEKTGEETSFEMDLRKLTADGYMKGGGRLDAEWRGPDKEKRKLHGTKITLKKLFIKRAISKSQFPSSMARRFLLHQTSDDFRIKVDGKDIPKDKDPAGVEYSFPQDYDKDKVPTGMRCEGDFGVETLPNGEVIKWKMYFYKETINERELQGITVFANGKLAQKPFFFNLVGGLGGQVGQSYMSGLVEADYLDQRSDDCQSTERQRVNWDLEDTMPLLDWGQKRVKELLALWRDKRGERRRRAIEDKVAGFSDRLEKLPKHEAKTVKKVLTKLGGIVDLKNHQYEELATAILTAWETGRLQELIKEIKGSDMLDSKKFLGLLVEAGVVSALNVAEAIKTKGVTIKRLKQMVRNKSLESEVRDHLAQNPWILSPEWETFRKETRANSIIREAAEEAGLTDDSYTGRVDLALSSGETLIVVEFMRPGLTLDWDHMSRLEQYVRTIKTGLRAATGMSFNNFQGLIVADRLNKSPLIMDKIDDWKTQQNPIYALDWEMLLAKASAKYKDYLDILSARGNGDERMAALRTND